MLWWVLEEIRARDEAREMAIAEEKVRKAIEAEKKIAEDENLIGHASSGKKEKSKLTSRKKKKILQMQNSVVKESEWKDGDECFRQAFCLKLATFCSQLIYVICSCHRPFSMTLRKHHCRACGQVFCDPCSSTQLLDQSQNVVRVSLAKCVNYTII